MTIEKGRAWGSAAPLPATGVLARSDAEAGAIVAAARRAGTDPPVIGLLGGDLCRTLGGTGEQARLRSGAAAMFPVDVGTFTLDGRREWFVAHLVVRNRRWTRGAMALNAQWLGRWNVGPRAHPNDGLLDAYEAHLTVRDLAQVRSRLATDSHLPHPQIRQRRAAAVTFDMERSLAVWADGVRLPGRVAGELTVQIEPDAAWVVV